MGYHNQVIKVACDFQCHVFPTRTPKHTGRPFLYSDTSPKSPEAFLRNLVTRSGEYHFSRFRQDLKLVLWTFPRLLTFKGTPFDDILTQAMDSVRTCLLPDEPMKLWKTYWQLDNCWQLYIRLPRRSFTGFSTQKLRFNLRYPYAIYSVQNDIGTAFLHALPFYSVTVLQWALEPKNHQTVSSQS